MEVVPTVLDLVGNTPLVALSRFAAGLPCPVLVKLETANPGGSVKDRAAMGMLLAAEQRGEIGPGATIVEKTSGNTGIGLAIVAAHRGYRCVFVMTTKAAPEKVALLRAYGAEVIVCPVGLAAGDPRSADAVVGRLLRERPNAYRPNQYDNPDNPAYHEATTGPELWRQTGGRITHFVATAGTGGTIAGTARFLKRQNPAVRIVVADPEGSVYSGGGGRPYLVEGAGEDFWPGNYDPSIVDEAVAVSDRDSFLTAREVAYKEGLLIGGSCGTAVWAACEVARRASASDLVVALLPDSGRGYLSKVFDDDWMYGYGFLRAEGEVVVDAIDQAQPFVVVPPQITVRAARSLLRTHGLGRAPVGKGSPPYAAADIVGSVSAHALRRADPDVEVAAVMGAPLPRVGAGEPRRRLAEALAQSPAAVVHDGGRPIQMVSRSSRAAREPSPEASR